MILNRIITTLSAAVIGGLFFVAQAHVYGATTKPAKPKPAPVVNWCNKAKTLVQLELKRQNITNAAMQCKGVDALSMQWLSWNERAMPYRSGSYHVDPQSGLLISDADFQPIKSYRPQAELKIASTIFNPLIQKAIQTKWAGPIPDLDPLQTELRTFRDFVYEPAKGILFRKHLSSSVIDKADLQNLNGREPGTLIFLDEYPNAILKGISMSSKRKQIENVLSKPHQLLKTGSGYVAHYVHPSVFLSFWYADANTNTSPSFVTVTERKRSGNAIKLIETSNRIMQIGKPPKEQPADWSGIARLTDFQASTFDAETASYRFSFPSSGVTGEQGAYKLYKNALVSVKDAIEIAKWLRSNPTSVYIDQDIELQRVHQRAFPFKHLFASDFETDQFSVKVAASNPYQVGFTSLYVQSKSDGKIDELYRDQPLKKNRVWIDPYVSDQLLAVKSETYPFQRDVLYRIDLIAAMEAVREQRRLPDWEIVFAPNENANLVSIHPKENGMYVLDYQYQDQSWTAWVPSNAVPGDYRLASLDAKPVLVNNQLVDRTVTARFDGTVDITGILQITSDCHVNDLYLERHPEDRNARICADPTLKQYAYLNIPLQQAQRIPQFATTNDLEASNASLRQFDVVQTVRILAPDAWWQSAKSLDGTSVTVPLSKLKYVFYQGNGNAQQPFQIEATGYTDLIQTLEPTEQTNP